MTAREITLRDKKLRESKCKIMQFPEYKHKWKPKFTMRDKLKENVE